MRIISIHNILQTGNENTQTYQAENVKKIRSFMSKGELKNIGNYSEACET